MDFEADEVIAVIVSDEATGGVRIAWNFRGLPKECDRLDWISFIGVQAMLKIAEAVSLADAGPDGEGWVH